MFTRAFRADTTEVLGSKGEGRTKNGEKQFEIRSSRACRPSGLTETAKIA